MVKLLRSNRFKRVLWICMVVVLVVGLIGCDQAKSWTGTPYKVLVVLVNWNNEPNCSVSYPCEPAFSAQDIADIHEPRLTGQETVELLDEKINTYYQKATFGKVYFDFELLEPPAGTRANSKEGWWDSPYALSFIRILNLEWKQLAVDIAFNALHNGVHAYDRILFISNMQHRGGQMCGLHDPTPFYEVACSWNRTSFESGQFDFSPIPMIAAEVGEGATEMEMITVASHELGHMLGAPDQYLAGTSGMGYWDLMGDDSRFYHFGAWTKLDRGWLDWTANTTRMPCVAGNCEIIAALDPVETQGNNALLIPTTGIDGMLASDFVGVMAECRKKINGDENIPEEGVLVTFSNPFIDNALAGTVSEVLTNEQNPYALLQPGEQYVNEKYGISITNISTPGELTCTVKAKRTIDPAPDIYITRGAVLASDSLDESMSVDIWNWDLLGTGIKTTLAPVEHTVNGKTYHEEALVADGFGDPIRYPGQNLIRFLIHNGGEKTAEDITVNVYLRTLLDTVVETKGCGAAADNLPVLTVQKLETIHFEKLSAGASADGKVYYTAPGNNIPFEIEVEIEPVVEELDTFNNSAQETYTQYYQFPGDNVPAYLEGMGVTLSKECTVGLPFTAVEVPAEDGTTCELFDLSISPVTGFIEPGETVNFSLSSSPEAGTKPGDSCFAEFSIMMPFDDLYYPVNTFGFEERMVDPADLTCSTPGGSSAPAAPVPVSGHLNPEKGDPVALLYTDPNGREETRSVLTALDGKYLDTFTPTIVGTWNVQAFWAGDESHPPTQSTVCQFKVEEAVVLEPAVFTAETAANCRQGTSIFYRSLGLTTVGSEYPLAGLLDLGGWYFIQLNETQACWVKADTGEAIGDFSGLELLHVDLITPTVVPTFTPTPPVAINCKQYKFLEICNSGSGGKCIWLDDIGKCVVK